MSRVSLSCPNDKTTDKTAHLDEGYHGAVFTTFYPKIAPGLKHEKRGKLKGLPHCTKHVAVSKTKPKSNNS